MKTEILRVKKKFSFEGIELRIVLRSEPYMNATQPVQVTRVIGPNNGVIPVQMQRGDTLKKIIERTLSLLNSFKERGADVKKELTKELV